MKSSGRLTTLKYRSVIPVLVFIVFALSLVQPLAAQEAVLPLPGRENDARAFLEAQVLASPVQSTNPEDFDLFGSTVAVEGDVLLVGAPYDNNDMGAVYVYARDAAGIWNTTAKLVPTTPNLGNLFGWSLDFQGGVAAIGAPSEGAVYIFQQDGSGAWAQTQKIQAGISSGLGSKVFLRGNRLAAQAFYDGTIEIYEQDAGLVWQPQASIELIGSIGYPYGTVLFAFDGDTLLQGGAYSVDGYNEVLVYEFDGVEWEVTQRLRSGANGPSFGASVALQGDQAFIASLDTATYTGFGIEVFEKQNGAWVSVDFIPPVITRENNNGPLNIVAAADRIVVGDYYNSAVYLFGNNGTGWEFQERIVNQPPTPTGYPSYFGYAVDLTEDVLVSSIPYQMTGGVTYIYQRFDYEPTELLVNGGFEDGENGWTLVNGSADKVKCGDASTPAGEIAQEGLCAFVFKGKPGEDSTLKQTISTTLPEGVTLSLTGFVKAKLPDQSTRIKLTVKYADASIPSEKVVSYLYAFGAQEYVTLNTYFPSLLTTTRGETKNVKVSINFIGQKGKVSYDGLSLIAQ